MSSAMTAESYANLVLDAQDALIAAVRANLSSPCEIKTRFLNPGTDESDKWTANLINSETGSIRRLVFLLAQLKTSDLAKTAGGKNFKPQIKINFELFRSYKIGTTGENPEREFKQDALGLQFAIETNKILPPQGVVDDYEINLGFRPSATEPMHYGRGEIKIYFREVRY